MVDWPAMGSKSALKLAIERVGGLAALAKALGISKQAVFKWAKRGAVPPLRVLDVERESGVSRRDLRPDLYSQERARA